MNIHGHIIDFIVAIVLMFLVTLLYFGQKQDSLVLTLVSTETESFVNEIKSQGYVTRDMYDEYLGGLSQTGLLYEVSLEHRQAIKEPEYRFRTTEEVIAEQNTAFTGTNVYTFRPISTNIPVVTDPENTGTLNTETNASILASAIQTPTPASHIHTDACFDGHRHTQSCRSKVYDAIVTVYHGTDQPPYTRNQIYLELYCGNCGELIWFYKFYGAWGGQGALVMGDSSNFPPITDAYGNPYYNRGNKMYSFNNVRANGSIGSALYTAGVDTNTKLKDYLMELNVYGFPLIESTYEYQSHYMKDITWNYTGGYPLGLESSNCSNPNCLGYSCGLIQDETLICNKIVTSITPTHSIQTVATGDPLITTVTANYKDGSTKVLVATTTFSTAYVVQNQTAVLTYSYSLAGIPYSKTCNISVSVIPRRKTCVKGHTYNLNSNGSDPGCPFCRAWLSSLSIVQPVSGNITIYKGTSLPGNGVTLLATYMDGTKQYLYTEYIDNLDMQFVGTQNVTLSFKGKNVTLTVISKRNLTLCGVCGRYYELYPDESDPGCPWCQSRTPIFTGNVLEYFDKNYTDEILKELYEGSGTYYFTNSDYILFNVVNRRTSWGTRLVAHFHPSLGESNIQTTCGGYIRENGS